MFVPWEADLQPLIHIGPSSAYDLLHGCRLKAVLSKHPNNVNCKRGLPIHPSAPIGTAVHALLEEAWKRDEPWTRREAKAALSRLLLEQDELLAGEPLDARHGPLHAHPYLAKGKLRQKKIMRAVEISRRERRTPSPGTHTGHRLYGPEVDVWDLDAGWPANEDSSTRPDYRVKGQVDEVHYSEGKVTVLDNKSGAISDKESGQLKPEYVLQVRLYAALWRKTALHRHNAEFPESALVLRLEGRDESREIPLGEPESELEKVQIAVDEVNDILNVYAETQGDAIEALATPNSDHCRYCRHRTGCVPYLNGHDQDGIGERPPDLFGTLEVEPYRKEPGSVYRQMRIRDSAGVLWLVDNVHESWPGMPIEAGTPVGVFGGYVVEDAAYPGIDKVFRCSKEQHAVYPRLE